MHVHEEVLVAANQIAAQRADWTFSPHEIVKALPVLNESSVRTHIVSRCCVNAPKNHPHKWDYFRRVSRGQYEVRSKYRSTTVPSKGGLVGSTVPLTASDTQLKAVSRPVLRDVIHAVVHPDEDGYYVECLEVAVVTQGDNLDDLVRNLDRR